MEINYPNIQNTRFMHNTAEQEEDIMQDPISEKPYLEDKNLNPSATERWIDNLRKIERNYKERIQQDGKTS